MSFDLKIFNGDLVLENADLALVTGQQKLVQDILKIALTPAGGSPLQPWYGSLINRTLVGSYLSQNVTVDTAQNQLQTAMENLQNLQKLQVASGQPVSPAEQIAFIKSIKITRNTIDPRIYQVSILVLSRAFGQVTAAFTADNL